MRSKTLTEKSLKKSLKAFNSAQQVDDEMSIFTQHRSTISVLSGLDSEANEWAAI